MVSFKNNNVDSDQSTPHRQLPGSLLASLSYSHSHRHNHLHRHDPPLPPAYCTPPPPPASSNYPTVQRGCALHSRLEQPVTSSSSGMDSKKVVQAVPLPVPVQVRSKNDGSGVAASVSGVRRRSGSQGLRSPAAKRPLSAPVALQGWLHKQGSEGLMLWKKRWFVLSEYCLFYYKGPEEEKLLGSILLPSYRVTVCKPEDKVNRKFAFKAEHANMRTYHFAADSRESMNQWVNALTLATLLQDPNPGAGEAAVMIEIAGQQDGERSGRPSVSSISSILNQSADDSDSGFHGFQSRDDPSHASNNNSSPNSANTASFPNLSVNNGNSNSNANNGGNSSNNNNNNTNSNTIGNAINNNANEIQPMVNGWIQQQPQYVQAGTSQQQQYGQPMPPSQQVHPHQHQALLHQHSSHQNAVQSHQIYQHKHLIQQQQTQSHTMASNVQTVQPMPRKFGQPIYANAPPKPRRLTDGSTEYSTPSPDPDYRKSPVSPDVTMTSKSPMSDYDRSSMIYGTRMSQPSQQSLRTDKSGLNYGYSQVQTERRTPDTYGRSAAKPRSSRGNGDYEEVYGAPQLYQRPAGPVGYSKGASPAPIPIPLYAQQHQQYQQQIHSPVAPSNGMAVMRQPRTQPPPRPHSADFLEYEATRKPQQQIPLQCEESLNQQRRPQRPKSSLDIVTPSDAANDGYFYSEERYAAQMRQSAVYLHQTPQHHQQQRNQSLSRATMPSKVTGIRDRSDESRIATLPEASCSRLKREQREHVHQQQHAIPHQSLQRHTEMNSSEAKLRRSLREKSYGSSNRELLTHVEDGTVPRRIPREYESSMGWGRPTSHTSQGTHVAQACHAPPHAGVRRWNEQQFCRSASARLPRTRHPAALDPDDDDYGERSSEQDSRDGERKIQQREESMKRLLEWKQRMLQSPLTRKPSGSVNRDRAQNELSSYYKQQALLELAAHEASVAESRHSRRREDNHRSHVRSKSSDGRRTVANVSRYNSYSSDDEELGDVRRKRTRRPSHAGRSPRQVGDSRSSGLPVQDAVPGNGRQSQNASRPSNDRKTSPTASRLPNLGGIPPDAGYEEVSFPSMQRNGRSPSYVATEQRSVSRNEQDMDASFDEENFRRKPSGILKTSSAYAVEQTSKNSNASVGYASEVWPVQKIVQWTSKKERDTWDCNIDESKVIKEFSYQYIKPKEEEDSQMEETSPGKPESMNLVRCRIRSFESSMDNSSPVKEVLAMQEPLKVSPLQATEAHVSRLDCSKKTSVIRNFALGESDSQDSKYRNAKGGHAKQASTDSNKSVKDLLADFERKSQQVQKQEYGRCQEVKHRGVFSDSEALLYDTGSDLDQRDKNEDTENDGGRKIDRVVPESIERDEVYADTTKKKTDVSFRRKKISPSKESINDRAIPTEDLDIVSNPSCTRLSVTESLLTHGDQFSEESGTTSPTVKQEDVNPEEHYLPMSPRKAILDPNCDDRPDPKMMESLFANLDHEESSYVEMAQNGMTRSLLAPDEESGKHDSGDYSTLDTPHYEFVCVSDSKMEPVYMEVSQLSEKEEKDCAKMSLKKKRASHEGSTHSRTDLPDILTALKSDSSDADDESSKDLDSIDAPRHPRFSLSDTFRPASYYLGASRTMIAELHDSSDSELVSPPPIPTSPPPLDDLDSLDMQESLEIKKVSPQVAATKDSSSNRDSPKSWNKPMGQIETHRPLSRFSDATISSTFRDSRISLESASGSDSVELRTPEDEARHRQLKTRPVSEVCEVLDSLDELESLGSRFDGASIDLDQYLEELQARDAFNVDLYAKDLSYNSIYGFNENMMVVDKLQKTICHDLSRRANLGNFQQSLRYGAGNKMGSASSLPSMRVCDVPPSHQHSQSFTGDAHYENIASFSPLRCSPAIRSDTEQTRDNVHSLRRSSQNNLLTASHSRDSSYSLASGVASISTSMACQRPASAQSSMHSPTGSISLGNHGNNLVTSVMRNASPYPDQRFQSHSRSASQDSARYSMISNHRSSSSQDSSHYPTSVSTSTVKANPAPQSYLPNEARPQSEQSCAPYYYSDLQASANAVDVESSKPIGHTSRLPQLNNQRDDASALNKRNDIGRIINPIARQIPRQIQVDDIDEARRIAAELRKTTCQLLGDNKVDLVDKKNFYEADTLRRVKSTDPLPDISSAEISTRNLYPHGLRDKSSGESSNQETFELTQTSHRRSRSLEGLLDDVGLQNLVEQRNRSNRVATVQPTQVEEAPRNVSSGNVSASNGHFDSEDPWEQDSLWRESLRRVSLRNARSLDNLDSPPRPAGSSSSEGKGRNKITRGATYVNDSVILRRDNCLDDPTERPRVKRRANKDQEREEETANDLTYESLSIDRIHASGYVWDAQNEAYRKATAEETNHFLEEGNLPPVRSISDAQMSAATSAAFELDREKLRQWDLLSSACLLQEQQRGSMADSGRGLPTVERPGDVFDSRNSAQGTTGIGTTATSTIATTIVTASDQRDVALKVLDIGVRNTSTTPMKGAIKRQEVNETKEACNRATGEWLLKTGGVYRK